MISWLIGGLVRCGVGWGDVRVCKTSRLDHVIPRLIDRGFSFNQLHTHLLEEVGGVAPGQAHLGPLGEVVVGRRAVGFNVFMGLD